MKLFVLAAAFAVCSGAKLDRTYLPPASAKSAGGSPGSLQTPLGSSDAPTSDAFQGIAVDSAEFSPSGRLQTSGLGAPASSYGSQNSKVGEAAFRGSQNFNAQHTFGQSGLSGFKGVQSYNNPNEQASVNQDSSNLGLPNKGNFNQGYSSAQSNFGAPEQPTRPQAAQERASGIIRQESDVGPESFNYSFETDNGIAAEENAVATDGVQAQGAFSYMGDDGQMYSVTYTADENGYQPHGAHLPTPPPIPEEILRSIEQNMRDEEAGIIDDGKYDAQKHGGGNEHVNQRSGVMSGQYNQYQNPNSGSSGNYGSSSQASKKQNFGQSTGPSRQFEFSSQGSNQYQGNQEGTPEHLQPSSLTNQYQTGQKSSQFGASGQNINRYQQGQHFSTQGKFDTASNVITQASYLPPTPSSSSFSNALSSQKYSATLPQRLTQQNNVPEIQGPQSNTPQKQGSAQQFTFKSQAYSHQPAAQQSEPLQHNDEQQSTSFHQFNVPSSQASQSINQVPVNQNQRAFQQNYQNIQKGYQYNSPSSLVHTENHQMLSTQFNPQSNKNSQQHPGQYQQSSSLQSPSNEYNVAAKNLPTGQFNGQASQSEHSSFGSQPSSKPQQFGQFNSQISSTQMSGPSSELTFSPSSSSRAPGSTDQSIKPFAPRPNAPSPNVFTSHPIAPSSTPLAPHPSFRQHPSQNKGFTSQKYTAPGSNSNDAYYYNQPSKPFSTPSTNYNSGSQFYSGSTPLRPGVPSQFGTKPSGSQFGSESSQSSQSFNAPKPQFNSPQRPSSQYNAQPNTQQPSQQPNFSTQQPNFSTQQPNFSTQQPNYSTQRANFPNQHSEETSVSSQQYSGEVYQYNKPESATSEKPESPAPEPNSPSSQQASGQFNVPQASSQQYNAQSQSSAGFSTSAPREEFGGPRQPPSFSAETGYHY